jgi:hypothetical protein
VQVGFDIEGGILNPVGLVHAQWHFDQPLAEDPGQVYPLLKKLH